MTFGIDKLRAAVAWANAHNENYWIPEERPAPTAASIVHAYELCAGMSIEAFLAREDASITDEQVRRLRRLLNLPKQD